MYAQQFLVILSQRWIPNSKHKPSWTPTRSYSQSTQLDQPFDTQLQYKAYELTCTLMHYDTRLFLIVFVQPRGKAHLIAVAYKDCVIECKLMHINVRNDHTPTYYNILITC